MAFGSRQRRIDLLEEQVRACADHAPFIGLAEEVAKRVMDQTASIVTARDVERKLGTIVQDLTEEGRQQKILRMFRDLPPDARVSILGRVFADEEMQVALAEERQRILARGTIEGKIAALATEAQTTRGVDLAQIPRSATAEIGLYNRDSYLEAGGFPDELVKRYACDRRLRAASLGDGRFQVLQDTLHRNFDTDYDLSQPRVEDHTVITLGGALGLDDQEHSPHTVYYGSGLNGTLAGDRQIHAFGVKRGYHDDISLVVGTVHANGLEIVGPNILE